LIPPEDSLFTDLHYISVSRVPCELLMVTHP